MKSAGINPSQHTRLRTTRPGRESRTIRPSWRAAARWGAKPAVCMALLFTLSSGSRDAGAARGGIRSGRGKLAGQVVPVFVHGDG